MLSVMPAPLSDTEIATYSPAGGSSGAFGGPSVTLEVPRHDERAAHVHRIPRVDHQVEHCKFELRRIHQRLPQIVVLPGLDAEAAPDGALHQVSHAGHALVEIEWLWFQPLPPGKRQKLIGQPGTAFGGGAHIAQPLYHLAVDGRR